MAGVDRVELFGRFCYRLPKIRGEHSAKTAETGFCQFWRYRYAGDLKFLMGSSLQGVVGMHLVRLEHYRNLRGSAFAE